MELHAVGRRIVDLKVGEVYNGTVTRIVAAANNAKFCISSVKSYAGAHALPSVDAVTLTPVP